MEAPADREYAPAHVWIRRAADGRVRTGVTHVPARFLGDAVYAELLPPGTDVAPGEPIGFIESSATVFEVIAPIGGTITAINPAAETSPETITADPYGSGWLVEIRPSGDPCGALVDAAEYGRLTAEE